VSFFLTNTSQRFNSVPQVPHRRHSAIDYLSPIDYERRYPTGTIDEHQSNTAPPPLAAGKIEDTVIEANCIAEASNQSLSPTPSTETG